MVSRVGRELLQATGSPPSQVRAPLARNARLPANATATATAIIPYR